MLYGRTAECREIDEVLTGLRSKVGASLLLTGETGIGKSALLDYAADHADGIRVLATTGVWFGTPPLDYAFQWQRCTKTSCRDIAGATQKTYLLTPSDVDAHMRVVVQATSPEGSASATSDTTVKPLTAPLSRIECCGMAM